MYVNDIDQLLFQKKFGLGEEGKESSDKEIEVSIKFKFILFLTTHKTFIQNIQNHKTI